VTRIERDDARIAELEEQVAEFLAEVDATLQRRVGVSVAASVHSRLLMGTSWFARTIVLISNILRPIPTPLNEIDCPTESEAKRFS